MKKVAVHNLGCKVNSYELDRVRARLSAAGYEETAFTEPADIYIVNTCTVTNIADRKSRQLLHRAKSMNPEGIVVAIGCYVETDRKRIEEDEAIDLAVGNADKERIAEILADFLEKRGEAIPAQPPASRVELVPARTRAFVKIQDGCEQYCTYCIIPFARGRLSSRDPEEVVAEVRGLAARGVSEVVLTGIHLSSYGKDRGEKPEEALLSLLRRLQLLAGIERIRLGSLEPMIMTEEFTAGLAGLSKFCPHFHLSLQSGSDTVLKRMNRHYTTAMYREVTERIRRHFDAPALTTDIIAGFPGETREEFEETLRFAEEIGFYEIHVFPYSRRDGTRAAAMEGQLTERQKQERAGELLELTRAQAARYRSSFEGKRERVLIEEEKEDGAGNRFFVGHTTRYVEVRIPGEELLPEDGAAEEMPRDLAGFCVEGTITAPPALKDDWKYAMMSPDERYRTLLRDTKRQEDV